MSKHDCGSEGHWLTQGEPGAVKQDQLYRLTTKDAHSHHKLVVICD